MRVELFSIGPLHVYGYGFMIAVGIFAALIVGMRRAKKLKLDADLFFNLTILCTLFGFLGAKILYIIIEFKSLMESGDWLADVSQGFVVYGGIIGGILAAYLYCRYKKVKFLKYFDLAMPSVALAQGFGRLGCFLAGCCYGRETSSAIGVVFHNSPYAPNNVSLLPTQLFSSAGDFLIAGFLIMITGRKPKDGIIASLYMILYGIGRFLIEFLRNDPRGSVGGLSTSQFISIFIVAGGLLMFFMYNRKKS